MLVTERCECGCVHRVCKKSARQDRPFRALPPGHLADVAGRDVDVERRLLDPLVAHPALVSRVHAERRGVGSERVAEVCQ
jgi:hypothetical protein